MSSTTRVLLLAAALFTCSRAAVSLSGAEVPTPQWPQFRGPGGNAVAESQSIPVGFGRDKNLRWETELPPGNSSPCIWGDRIFLTAHVGTTLKMICLKRSDGAMLWERERTIPKLAVYEHVAGDPANSTPATDGQRVVFQFDDFGVVVLDFAGELKWEKQLSSTKNNFSTGTRRVQKRSAASARRMCGATTARNRFLRVAPASWRPMTRGPAIRFGR